MSIHAAEYWDGATFKLRGQQIQLNLVRTYQPGIVPHPNWLVISLSGSSALRESMLSGWCKLWPISLASKFWMSGILEPKALQHRTTTSGRSFLRLGPPPTILQGVSVIFVDGAELMLHHFQRFQAPPCWWCLNPQHTQSRCKAHQTTLRAEWGPVPEVSALATTPQSAQDDVDMDSVVGAQPTEPTPASRTDSPSPDDEDCGADQTRERQSFASFTKRHPAPATADYDVDMLESPDAASPAATGDDEPTSVAATMHGSSSDTSPASTVHFPPRLTCDRDQ
ncbi:unnamed protein product [Phytophthora fragariaefolia]|uniref:Unnamed protein product n=1 Tax=Phytophthora fragariaefolia TaxID=1490495 RepID=A0A9W7D029_9STRA|nr:unnamed protein product [Phytophthora fragariaefolia]